VYLKVILIKFLYNKIKNTFKVTLIDLHMIRCVLKIVRITILYNQI